MLTKQLGFFEDVYIGNIRAKLSELCINNPDIVTDERKVLLEYWRTFDNLDSILGDKLPDFLSWWEHATLPETLSRCLRSLKEQGTVKVTHEDELQKHKQEQQWRSFWGNEKGMRENDGQD